MAPRPNWKGYLKLGLVSCPIALYPATSNDKRVSFRRINKVTGNRLRQQLVDESARFTAPHPPHAEEMPVTSYEAPRRKRAAYAEPAEAVDQAEMPVVKGRGYEIGSGVFIPVSDAELDATRVDR